MKKILVLCHSASIGGAELALASLIESTKDLYSWHLVFADSAKAPAEITRYSTSINYMDLPWWCYEAHDKPKTIYKKTLDNSMKNLEHLAEDADILLTNTITIPWLGFVAQKLQKPHIWYIHEFGDIDHNLKFIYGYKKSLGSILSNSSRVLTISQAVKNHIAVVIPKDKIDIIHQSIDFSNIPFCPVDLNALNTIKIAALGAIKPSKGQHIVLDAVKILRSNSERKYTLDIKGPNANNLFVKNIKIKALNLANISVQDKYFNLSNELKSHDVLVVASENEALGRITLEGLAAGKVVIGYSCTATADLLGENRGILYEPNTPKTLSLVLKNIDKLSDKINPEYNRAYTEITYGNITQKEDFIQCVNKLESDFVKKNNSYTDYISVLKSNNLFTGTISNYSKKIQKSAISKTPKAIKAYLKKARSS